MKSSESRCSTFDLSHLLQCFHLSLHLVYTVVVELRRTDKLRDPNESNVLVGEQRRGGQRTGTKSLFVYQPSLRGYSKDPVDRTVSRGTPRIITESHRNQD
ncbi:uncharacterized protein LOC143427818 [Xylocopa sonorina]|uniref:uncharacterized protein LOC143427818 n=1 Tax=Xylocopa sonorina TaxID=1818115 RepID=UPI00403B2B83